MPRTRPHRIVFYIGDSQFQRLGEAIQESGMERADWLRAAVDGAASGAPQGTSSSTVGAPAELAAAHATIQGQQDLIQQMRERQGMSDSLNQELSQRLKESLASNDRLQLMLPAAGQTGRPWWKLW